ncbi:MAG TPA: hypothetical protein VHI11_10225 [Jiangellaceae bacterium]|nr:hypothetical protein [Jiangellaceae bacterium]
MAELSPAPQTNRCWLTSETELVAQEGEPIGAGGVSELMVAALVQLDLGVGAGGGERVADVLADEEVVAGPLEEDTVAEAGGVVDRVKAREQSEVISPRLTLEDPGSRRG